MRLTQRLKKDIENHAQGSLYRMNSGSADCYAFNIVLNSKGKLDFVGGWDWSTSLIDKQATHIYMLKSKIFKTLEPQTTGAK